MNKQQLQSTLEVTAVEHIRVEGDVVVVEAGPFHGTHAVRQQRDGGFRATTKGTYYHEPTDTEFEAECPDELQLQDRVRDGANSEGPAEAARAAYQRSRM